jgi:sec-independent protein translocase protein TatA
MPALGAPELIIILVIIILIFGVGKLPEVGSAFGKGIKEFRKANEELDKPEEPARPAPQVEAPRPAAAVEAPRPREDGVVSYTVQEGDTLDAIARRHEISVEALMQANGYTQRDRVLYAGDRIQVPRTTKSAS